MSTNFSTESDSWDFCASPFWDSDLISKGDRPNFTPCFRNTICIYIPCVFLWLFDPYYTRLWRRLRHDNKLRAVSEKWPFWSTWVIAKLVTSCLALAALVAVTVMRVIDEDSDPASAIGAGIFSITLGLEMMATILHKRAVHMRSRIQFFFWLLTVIFTIPAFVNGIRSLMSEVNSFGNSRNPLLTLTELDHQLESKLGPLDAYSLHAPHWESILWLAFYSLSVLSFLLHCWSDIPDNCCEEFNKEERASAFSDLVFAWLDPVLWKGVRQPLVEEDVPGLRDGLHADQISDRLDKHLGLFRDQKHFEEEDGLQSPENEESVEMLNITDAANEGGKAKKKSESDKYWEGVDIVPSLVKGFGFRFLIAILLKIVQDVVKFVSPQILKRLIRFAQSEDDSDGSWQGYALAVLLFLVNCVQMVLIQQYWKRAYLTGMEMKVATVSAIYRKSLRLSNDARREYTVGQIVNLMSSDAQTIQEVLPSLNMVWSMPLQILLALFFLYWELGPALFSGVLILVLLIPFNIFSGRMTRMYQTRQMKCKDLRIRAMYEILGAMRIIKLNAWEESFQEKVSSLRGQEIGFLRRNAVLKSFVNFVFGSAPILVTLASFATYVYISEENVLTADKVFVCLSLFNLLRLPMHLLPNGITEALRLSVSLKRINKFLRAEEMGAGLNRMKQEKEKGKGDLATIDEDEEEKDKYAVEIEAGSFSWGRDLPIVVKNVSFKFPSGSLIAVVGRIGSGKSSLLSAILGEMDTRYGEVKVKCDQLALVSQQPWIQNMSVRDNIVFGKETKGDWYDHVVDACALKADFEQLTDGDKTLIGEQGINLSGGQKQRVSIARAVYRKTDLYLFDDPLSALDSHTANHVFDKVLSNSGILSGSTRVLVTHRTNIVSQADFILVMKEGSVAEFGPSNQILSRQNSELSLWLEEMEDEETPTDKTDGEMEKQDSPEKKIKKVVPQSAEELKKAAAAKEIAKRLKDEAVLTGRVETGAYKAYFQALGYASTVLLVFNFMLNQAISTGKKI